MSKAADVKDLADLCQSCRFGTGEARDCSLIVAGRIDALLEKGPCRLERRYKNGVIGILTTGFPDARPQAALVAERGLADLKRQPESFPGSALKRLIPTVDWLERRARNDALDILTRQGDIETPSCGQCRQFSGQGCRLEHVPDASGQLRPNPWWGDRVDADTEPRGLDPACESFELKDLLSVDVLDGLLGPSAVDCPSTAVLLGAVEEIAGDGEDGFLEAIILRRHLLAGEPLDDVAELAQVPTEFLQPILAKAKEKLASRLTENARS